MNTRKAIDVIENFKDESPKLYQFALSIINGQKVDDGVYSSEVTDNQRQVYNYFSVHNNEINAIGEERGREGGWYWFNK